jgi:hypothetical protein
MNGSTIQILQFVFENTTTNVVTDSYGVIDYDTTSAFILQTVYQSKSINYTALAGDLCKLGEKKLSPIHLAAAKGLVTFLKQSRSLFGSNILNCHDYNNITPLYLAQIYNQTIVIQWMKGIQVHRAQPKPEVEGLLIYNFLSNYNTFRVFDWTCRLQYSYRHVGLILQQVNKCLSMMSKRDYPLLYQNPFHTTILRILFTFLQSLSDLKLGITSLKFCDRKTIAICSSAIAHENLVRTKVKALHKVVYICLRKEIKFGSFDRIYLYQMVLRYVLKQSELKYVKELSFHSVFSFHFRYLEHLNMRKDIHTNWLSQLTEHLQMEYTFTFQSYLNRENQMMLWLISLSRVSGMQQLLKEKNERFNLEVEEYSSKEQRRCQSCDFETTLEIYKSICSVTDVLEMEDLCQEYMKDNDIEISDTMFTINIYEFIDDLKLRANKDPLSKKKVKLVQRIYSMVLYFMQFIPEDRKSTVCMRLIILQAEKVVNMSL